ncbi:MAG: PEP-CTERM sorting domain-containing protein [Verrucomicrobiaceae bacterium]
MKSYLILLCASALPAGAATLMTLSATGSPSTQGWTITTTSGDGGQNGEFSGNSASNAGGASGAGAGNPAWALYANSGQTASATYALAGGALSVGQALGIDFDNGYIETGGSAGIEFLNGTTQALLVSYSNGDASYRYADSSGSTLSGIGWTGDGFNVKVTMTASGTYSLDMAGSNFTGTLANTLPSFDTIRVYNNNAGGGGDRDVYFNNLQVVPEPSSALLGGIALLGLLGRRR